MYLNLQFVCAPSMSLHKYSGWEAELVRKDSIRICILAALSANLGAK